MIKVGQIWQTRAVMAFWRVDSLDEVMYPAETKLIVADVRDPPYENTVLLGPSGEQLIASTHKIYSWCDRISGDP